MMVVVRKVTAFQDEFAMSKRIIFALAISSQKLPVTDVHAIGILGPFQLRAHQVGQGRLSTCASLKVTALNSEDVAKSQRRVFRMHHASCPRLSKNRNL